MTRRAFTMIELLITISITAVVVGVMASLFGFAAVRLSDAYTKAALCDQVNGVADRIEATVRNSVSCATLDAGATLKCGLPDNGIDTDGDGYNDTYYPDSNDANGTETYVTGNYAWFYNAGSTGAYNVGSGDVWRAERPNGGTITATNIDTAFAYYYGNQMRYPLVASVSFTVNSAAQTVTYTITGSTRMGAETSSGATDSPSSRTLVATRTVQWRN